MKWETLLNANRRRQTTIGGDHRTQFERDFDRSVFSTPVKRLQDKAQVFPLEPHDAVRTRLTHSLEVSCVARGLATSTSKWLIQQCEIEAGSDRYIEAIAATCGLIHDLGNPPFGHSGEDAIRSWFNQKDLADKLKNDLSCEQQRQDFLSFEGNAQSLRLVATLQVLADRTGLNLTFGTLSALRKYVVPSDKANKDSSNRAWRKPGYFASENAVVEAVKNETGTGDARNPICFLIEAADDIVYLAADVEDAVKKGILRWNDVESKLDAKKDSILKAIKLKETILKAGRPEVPTDLDDDTHAAAFRTAAIGVMTEAVVDTFKKLYQAIMEGRHEGDLLDESEAKELAVCLRTIGQTCVYPARTTLTLELMGRHVIHDLMDIFWEGAETLPIGGEPKTSKFEGKAAALISANYRRIFRDFATEKKDLPEIYHRFQLVTDYICGMTDSFAKRLHSELFNGI
jgi:dGTPase